MSSERWLSALWPVVSDALPPAPARVVEIGCGSLGGFVPLLLAAGYDAVGVDPHAPEGDEYRRTEFENAERFDDVSAVIASASLHHVDEPEDVLGRIEDTLGPAGRVVVVEWAWEDFDEPTARWCFERLAAEGATWLHRHRERWLASGRPWVDYLQDWARGERLHEASKLVRLLDERFEREHLARQPYFFADLPGTGEREEQAAIDAGEIRATRVDYVGRRAA